MKLLSLALIMIAATNAVRLETQDIEENLNQLVQTRAGLKPPTVNDGDEIEVESYAAYTPTRYPSSRVTNPPRRDVPSYDVPSYDAPSYVPSHPTYDAPSYVPSHPTYVAPRQTYTDHVDCDCDCNCNCYDDTHYNCPPALEKCPGVAQPPGPCEIALCAAPLCYCNNGHMNTDWDHKISVDNQNACDDCGNNYPLYY